jgi:hypothetical protein
MYCVYVNKYKRVNAELSGKIKIYRAFEVQVIYFQLYQV